MTVFIQNEIDQQSIICYLIEENTEIEAKGFLNDFLQNDKRKHFISYEEDQVKIYIKFKREQDHYFYENLRMAASALVTICQREMITLVALSTKYISWDDDMAAAFLEGLKLATYRFEKYKSEKDRKPDLPDEVMIDKTFISEERLIEVNSLFYGVNAARNLVNEPPNVLTVKHFAEKCKEMADESKIDCEILNKEKIRSLRMGGLLAVSKGGQEDPAVALLSYDPADAVNEKPVVFVGKGVVFDTGGYNIKTGTHMEKMKCDMGGGASVLGSILSIARNKLPVKVKAIIPICDNRINEKGFVPDDIITMHSGATVEVINTDAEGRLILADALSFAKTMNPELVIDMATLTGAAVAVTGHLGAAYMGNVSDEEGQLLEKSGEQVFERVVKFPFWKEYNELIQSDVADIRNVGAKFGGATTAGKFLEFFTDYPWVHLDIAGPAFVDSPTRYYSQKGGTGFGVRLAYRFIKDKFLS